MKKVRNTPAQKKALDAYNFCLREEDRYFGSVFCNAVGQKRQEAKTQAAYQNCLTLGMTQVNGL